MASKVCRRRRPGKHLLFASISHFDPYATLRRQKAARNFHLPTPSQIDPVDCASQSRLRLLHANAPRATARWRAAKARDKGEVWARERLSKDELRFVNPPCDFCDGVKIRRKADLKL
jgi:hypothetical protein